MDNFEFRETDDIFCWDVLSDGKEIGKVCFNELYDCYCSSSDQYLEEYKTRLEAAQSLVKE